MTIVLSPGLQQLVEQKVKAGQYASAEEMVRAGLVRLLQDEHAFAPGELDRLVQVGQAKLDRGEGIDAADVFDDLRRRSAEARRRSAG